MARIDPYEFGRIVLDGRQETKDVIVLPGRVVANWWRRDGHALVLDDLVEVLDQLPSQLVVGTGADGRLRPDPDTIHQLQDRRVTVEALPPARPCAATLSS
jgi:hypothetical protein